MTNRSSAWLAAACCGLSLLVCGGAEVPLLEDEGFEQKLQALQTERNEPDRLHRAKSLVVAHRLSSLQVKAMAARLADDSARLDFALAAYPRVVDPENFYEVYDAFRSFSKVLRLHDQIRPARQPAPMPAPVMIHPPTDEEMNTMLQAVRKEDFDNNRIRLARQILSGGGRKFLARQVKRMVECLDFESGKLELAKYAYDFTLDRDQYFLVNEAFDFASSRESLSKFVESRQAAR